MATSDMSLGGGAGFGAGYTPIQFAPLVSLTGPVMAPTAPAAPEAAAPLIRPPVMADQGGGYETPQRTDEAFQNLQPIGERLATPEGRAAELQNLGRAVSALMSPFTTIPSLALTGRTPMELMAQAMGIGGAQSAQATPAAPFGGFLQGLQNLRDSFARNVFGPEEVPLAGGPSGVDPIASYQNAINVSLSGGATQEMADAAGRAALGLISQGMDPTAAVALASMTALGQVGPQMQEVAPTQPMGASMLGGNMQAFGGYTQGGWDDPDRPESSYSPSDFTGGGWSAGDVAGAYSDSTGFE